MGSFSSPDIYTNVFQWLFRKTQAVELTTLPKFRKRFRTPVLSTGSPTLCHTTTAPLFAMYAGPPPPPFENPDDGHEQMSLWLLIIKKINHRYRVQCVHYLAFVRHTLVSCSLLFHATRPWHMKSIQLMERVRCKNRIGAAENISQYIYD